jgi:hypothetical protein
MPRMQRGDLPTSTLTSSPNMPVIFAKIKNFKHHMDAWDMSDPFVIPTLINPDAVSVEDCWAERKLTGVHLLENWGKLTL